MEQPKFEGECKELQGHIYDCSDAKRQSDMFHKTTEEIADYVGRTYWCGHDVRLAVKNLQMPNLEKPENPPSSAGMIEILKWEREMDLFGKQRAYLRQNLKSLYSLVWGQCTYDMRFKIKVLDNFDTMSADRNGLALLKAIQDIVVYNFQSRKYLRHGLHEAMRRFYGCVQGNNMTTQAYLKQFQHSIAAIECYGGSVGNEPAIEKALADERGLLIWALTPEELDELKKEAQEQYLATAFLLGADRGRYSGLIVSLENAYLLGNNNYPQTVSAAYNMLENTRILLVNN
uniref:Uncharacterized protein n=1 Tax=Attheya septentrionalis TaxID=420275 RepID=A0A7S2UAI5_9STRA|mmetsp:Transcript_17494/g.31574  ORF Transcript_17494/g.31574 Transcript_17494/m.31574 type:complete len:288 (+) Transcript_17494:127-990(+)|eukprot:CAMPEP_0198293460 /NCGR_PEP_ID=MMETSP1449-20131203/17332_1 /TAXON_ID=420275 /ORGANISM="Attheya septentrionalis, Strain CCMP2084" /LENGTH=287 /DNA_ID=CAMNT_0043993051 /DNA_START=124 /DNA_END=987 /DNA_ORIENTATION=+